MKLNRQSVIMEIISQNCIETQAQLIKSLADRGIRSTQATLSRDIRELNIQKQTDENGITRYVAAASKSERDVELRLKTILRESVVSCDTAQNLFVIRTIPGLASAACSALDSMGINGLLGTIAGDDTALLIFRDNDGASAFYREVEELI